MLLTTLMICVLHARGNLNLYLITEVSWSVIDAFDDVDVLHARGNLNLYLITVFHKNGYASKLIHGLTVRYFG